LSSIKKKERDRLVALFIAEDLRPISVVEGKGLRRLVERLDPRYTLPTRLTLVKTLIPSLVGEEKDKIAEDLKFADAVCLTTDLWSSITCTSFMAMTAHFLNGDGFLVSKLLDCSRFEGRHTSENLTTRILDVIADFDISEKVVGIVSDNAANIKKAVADSGYPSIGCFAHSLNLVVMDALKHFHEFAPLCKRISDFATLLHRSNNAKEDFVKCQKRLGMKLLVPIKDVKTRWNSVFSMLKRFGELKEAIVLFQTTDHGRDFTFSHDDWLLASDVKKLLEPAFEATVELSGESYVSGSKILPMTKSLLTWYARASRRYDREEPGGFKKQFVDTVSQKLYFHFGSAEKVDLLAMATLCDPRYKKQGFREVLAASNAVGKLKREMANHVTAAEDDSNGPAASMERENSGGGTGLWESFDQEVHRRSVAPNAANSDVVAAQVVKYFQMKNLPRTSDPLAWWDTVGKDVYPLIYQVAKRHLVVPGTSVPSERVFSSAGGILTKKRSLLSDKNAAALIFLKENLKRKKME
jgi:hypothetical protein